MKFVFENSKHNVGKGESAGCQHFLYDPLPDMPILGSSNSTANNDMM